MQDNGAPGGARKFGGINWAAVGVIVSAAVSAGGTAWAVNRSYFEIVADVREIKLKNAAQDERMARIEKDQVDQRSSADEKLRDIQGDVKEIRNYLLNNSAGSRPDVSRWSRR
ncbi:hypothetical protein FP568_13220 [Pandoraea pnomenusa]|uniref:hypothetical protein n=1 Tax=Pandoraea pnomenusa TaxID=93220 RepID=UPI0011983EC5|nr:hypothetical protein [Pandoraea pnomenusa]QDX22121.1 hypothetical protein FP568_13220 [Pandoraea pnomenusa]